MDVTVEKRGDVFGGRWDFVFLQDADDDSGIGHAGDFDIVKIVGDFEAFGQPELERLDSGAPGMNQGAVDIEKEQALTHFCHVERSRTSLTISEITRLNSFVSRLSRRYPRGATVHVARPTRSIPRLRSELQKR